MGSLEILLVNIRSKQKTELVPVYVPPEELSSKSIATEWEKLDKDMINYEKSIKRCNNKNEKVGSIIR